jgi:hypothetical protein
MGRSFSIPVVGIFVVNNIEVLFGIKVVVGIIVCLSENKILWIITIKYCGLLH